MINGSDLSSQYAQFGQEFFRDTRHRSQRKGPQSFLSLMYHNVTAPGALFPRLSPSITSYFVDRTVFERHMRIVSERAEPVALHDIRSGDSEDHRSRSRESNRSGIQITFDDGWSGSVYEAGPVLENFDLRAHLFVTTDLIGRPGFLTRRELQNLPAKTFGVGSHARSHRLLNQLSEPEISGELQSSKQTLEDLLGTEVDTLSIPGGATDDRVLRIARKSGYRFVFTSDVHLNSAETLKSSIGRVAIRSTTTDDDIRRWALGRLGRDRLRNLTLRMSRRLLGESRYGRIRRCLFGEDRGQDEMVDLSAAGAEPLAACLQSTGQAREAC